MDSTFGELKWATKNEQRRKQMTKWEHPDDQTLLVKPAARQVTSFDRTDKLLLGWFTGLKS